MKSPLIIIVELLTGVATGIFQTIAFVVGKFGELMMSLLFLSALGPYGFLLALVIGAIVFLLVTKFIFKTAGSLLGLGIALAAMFAVLFLLRLV